LCASHLPIWASSSFKAFITTCIAVPGWSRCVMRTSANRSYHNLPIHRRQYQSAGTAY
jgi:hypothetical protein